MKIVASTTSMLEEPYWRIEEQNPLMDVNEILPRVISAVSFPIFLFKRGEILQIQSYGQKQTSNEEPTQLKMVRYLE